MGEWLLSRRDRLIVARHEVPGKASSQESRPVGYGLFLCFVQVSEPIRVIEGLG
jgi:hypothetical protein